MTVSELHAIELTDANLPGPGWGWSTFSIVHC